MGFTVLKLSCTSVTLSRATWKYFLFWLFSLFLTWKKPYGENLCESLWEIHFELHLQCFWSYSSTHTGLRSRRVSPLPLFLGIKTISSCPKSSVTASGAPQSKTERPSGSHVSFTVYSLCKVMDADLNVSIAGVSMNVKYYIYWRWLWWSSESWVSSISKA